MQVIVFCRKKKNRKAKPSQNKNSKERKGAFTREKRENNCTRKVTSGPCVNKEEKHQVNKGVKKEEKISQTEEGESTWK